jgi:hypothetical protein
MRYTSDLWFYVCLALFAGWLLWILWEPIQSLAAYIENMTNRRRLHYGAKPKLAAAQSWRPKPPTIPFWQFWYPKSGCFLTFAVSITAFLLYLAMQYLSH